MANGIRTGDPRGFNKGRSSKFCVGSGVRQTPEKCRWTYQPKRSGNNNKYEYNILKTLNDKNNYIYKNIFDSVDSVLCLRYSNIDVYALSTILNTYYL